LKLPKGTPIFEIGDEERSGATDPPAAEQRNVLPVNPPQTAPQTTPQTQTPPPSGQI